MVSRLSCAALLVWALAAPAAATTRFPAASAPPIAPIPFTLAHHKVLLPVRVNGSRPLLLTLDSGMGFDGVLLFDPALRDSLGGARWLAARQPGAGSGPPSAAFVAESLGLQIGGIRIENQRVIVLGDSAMMGRTSEGVIGYTLRGRYAVEIDYERRALVLHDPPSFEPARGWTSLALTLDERHLPFLEVAVAVGDEAPRPLRVYVDFASSETIELLTRPGMKFTLPPRTTEVVLGRGLSGEIRGRRGTISRLVIGPHELRNVVAAFVPAAARSRATDADAVLSNGVLCRFDVVFDYAHARLLVRPNRQRPDESY